MKTIRMNDPDDVEKLSPVESEKYPGFYQTALVPHLLVSRKGLVINRNNGKFLTGYKADCPSASHLITYHLNGKTNAVSVHRLVAATFCGRPTRHLDKALSDLVVNHIDFIRNNNDAENLEWVTQQENSWHATLSGRNQKARQIEAFNPFTKDRQFFLSARQCADHFKIKRQTFYKHLKTKTNAKRWGYVFRYSDDSWFFTDYHSAFELGSGNVNRTVILFDKKTKKKFIFDNLFSIFKHYLIPRTRVYKALKRIGLFENEQLVIKIL